MADNRKKRIRTLILLLALLAFCVYGALSAMWCHLTGAGPKGFWKFNSKQGHYSAVLVSDKKTTVDCINYPAK
jgi:hypothetical protein